jgi:hypothetical protein
MATIDEVYGTLKNYIRWLASYRQTDHVLMQADELESELREELVKGFLYYKERNLPDDELLKVIKQMLFNRIGELVYRFHATHRSAEVYAMDYDSAIWLPAHGTTEDEYDGNERVSKFLRMLTLEERTVARMILIGEDARWNHSMELKSMRRTFVFHDPTVSPDHTDVMRAMTMNNSEAHTLWLSLKFKWWQSGGYQLTKSEIAKRFGKRKLLDIAEELDIDVESGTHVYTLVDIINSDLSDNGLPAEDEEVSDDLFDYLVAAGLIDEDGEPIEDSEPEQKGGSVEELPKKLPGCWGQGEPKDPACRRCEILHRCKALRLKQRPTCFGDFSEDMSCVGSEDERGCLYRRECKQNAQ